MRRSLSLLLLIAVVIATLVACESKPDPNKNPITSKMLLGDLAEYAVADLADPPLQLTGPIYIEGLEVTYTGKNGEARFLLRALNPEHKQGINGTVTAHYLFENNDWKLSGLVVPEAAQMSAPYAQRLSELIDYPLHFAANIGDQQRVAQELEKGTDVNAREGKKGSTAVMFASERGFLPIVKMLVENGANVSHANKFGYTALHAATSGKYLEVSRYLLDNGADVNAKDDRGRTPLFTAAENGSLELVRMLKENGAEIDAQDLKLWSPLYAAADSGSLEVARYLIEQGARVRNDAAGSSRSPLLTASYSGNAEMVKLLLEAGADVSARLSMGHSPYRGMTALQLARMRGHDDVVELLKKAGAE